MPKKSKYTAEEKIKAVEDYFSGRRSRKQILQDLGIGKSTLRCWIMIYQAKGAAGLQPCHPTTYPPETKKAAVEDYLSGAYSLSDVCKKHGIPNTGVLRGWLKKDTLQRSSHKRIYPEELKKAAVDDYVHHGLTITEITDKYGISSRGSVYAWLSVDMLQRSPCPASQRSPRKKVYSESLKKAAVEDCANHGLSLSEAAAKYGVSNPSVVYNWLKMYNNHVEFKDGGNGRMVKGRKTSLEERVEIVSYCIANNRDYYKTIEQYGVSYQQIYSWVGRYEKEGAQGLFDRRGKRKDEASMSEVEKLRVQLKLKEAENLKLQMENDLLKKLAELERGRNGA